MTGRLALTAAVLATTLQLTACGEPQTATCGSGGGRPHPEIGGQVLYYCSDWPAVNGGLYLLDVATGRVHALTTDLAWNLDGAWSPDGARIAFQSSRLGRDDLFVLDVAGGGVRRLTDGRGFNEYPAWSPDGQWITFNSSRDGVAGSSGTGYYRDLYLMRAGGGGLRRLTSAAGSNTEAAWHPDGRSLAFQSDRGGSWDIYTMDLDGTGFRKVTHHEGTSGSATFPRWSADGSRLAFSSAAAGMPSSIYWLDVAGGDLHRVTFAVPGLRFDGYPDWSPDGRWIVFTRSRGDVQLFAVHPDGSGLTQLTDGPGDKDLPRWRPA